MVDLLKITKRGTFSYAKLEQIRIIYEKEGMQVVEARQLDEITKRKAVKIYDGCDFSKEHLNNRIAGEIILLGKLCHPNLLRLEAAIYSKRDKTLSLITPLYEQGSLAQVLKRTILDTQWKWRCFIEIGSAVKYIHSHFIVHGDIKPPNILVSASGKTVLADFDSSRSLRERIQGEGEEKFIYKTRVHNWTGTKNFRGPEYERGKPVDPYKMDAYALGITMFVMFFDNLCPEKFNPEFHTRTRLQEREDVQSQSFHLLLAVNRLVRKDPVMRRSIHRVFRDITHPEIRELLTSTPAKK